MEKSKSLTRFSAVYPMAGNRSPEAEYGCHYLANFLQDKFEDDRLVNTNTLSFPYFETISDMADAGYTCIWIGSSKALGACKHLDDLVVIQIPEGIMLFAAMDVDSANAFLTYVSVNQFFYDYNVYLFMPNFPDIVAKDLEHLYPLKYRDMSRGKVFYSSILSEKQLYHAVVNRSMLYPLIDLDPTKVATTMALLDEAFNHQYPLLYEGMELYIEGATYLEGEEILTVFLNTYASLKSPGKLEPIDLLPIGDRLQVKEVEGLYVYFFYSDQGGYYEVAQSEHDIFDTVYAKFIRGEYLSPLAARIANRYLGYLVSVETKLF